MLTHLDIANYFLVLVDREAKEEITRSKLYELIHIAQEISITHLHKPLLDESTTQIGERAFEGFENSSIPAPKDIDFSHYNTSDKQLMLKVYTNYEELKASPLYTIHNDFLSITDQDLSTIEQAEDQWWMNYDCEIVSEDVSDQILESFQEIKAGQGIKFDMV